MATNAPRQILNYSSPDTSTSAACPYAAVNDGAVPETFTKKCLEAYQPRLLIRKGVLRVFRDQFNNDKTQAFAALRLEKAVPGRYFAANPLWLENRSRQREAQGSDV